ncbi:N-acetylglucosamine-6-phosphate deacetylase [Paenactinomyces guangxiensis]|uniref:N-acetylglucosamine-6-phosphate deacetylase n=1 Tax=Paenactinomyces guangxiensis TaxID=1490290 RepID=A0A7W1WMX3_9BACL|nr:N-acetylglucosamine-6-phosphate deacetylase [Paenactinomyces guangxiensis]MBA4492863.1 N-acetylglucosamine-6-phosphate deacetylase [Paenactinomyces guangxiensis]MBH8590288.1 N-acetylglucosamine-6-phosphate deacetylase [Paenactinomyces guangxiensis]
MMENKMILIVKGTIHTETESLREGYIKIADGKIVELGPLSQCGDTAGFQVISVPEEAQVIPGMIDVHIHGADGADTMDATTESLTRIATAIAREGTTTFLATTITQSKEAIAAALANAADYIVRYNTPGKAECAGIHLEGPFLSAKRAGAQPPEYIIHPDIELFQHWQSIAQNLIKLVTLAPEVEGGLSLTRHLRETGVVASIGHSDATYDQCVEAIAAGASHVTHLFNGMRGLHHRDPGVVGAAFLQDELVVEVIADGIHIRPETVKIAFDQITDRRMILITDSMRAKCLKRGTYELGGQTVYVDQDARLADGTLAGSILKMKDAFKNIKEFTGCSMSGLIRMSASNAAKELGLFDRKGSIAIGKDADLVVLDDQWDVSLTLCRGKVAYDKRGMQHVTD